MKNNKYDRQVSGFSSQLNREKSQEPRKRDRKYIFRSLTNRETLIETYIKSRKKNQDKIEHINQKMKIKNSIKSNQSGPTNPTK